MDVSVALDTRVHTGSGRDSHSSSRRIFPDHVIGANDREWQVPRLCAELPDKYAVLGFLRRLGRGIRTLTSTRTPYLAPTPLFMIGGQGTSTRRRMEVDLAGSWLHGNARNMDGQCALDVGRPSYNALQPIACQDCQGKMRYRWRVTGSSGSG